MLKLYKKIDGILHYWETWEDDNKTATIHWGIVGQTGESKEIKSGLFISVQNQIQKEIQRISAQGYERIDQEYLSTLIIEYEIDGMGTQEDINKRYDVENRIDELLGWSGTGNCDGGSIGSGTMEVCCYVVNFDIAKELITNNLKGTEFGNYSRIYDESLI